MNLIEAIINLLNGFVGFGFMSYAYGFKFCGYLPGILISIVYTIMTYHSLHILTEKTHYLYNDKEIPDACYIGNYQDIVRYHLGRVMYYITCLAVFVSSIAGFVAYFQVIEALIMPLLEEISAPKSIWVTPYFVSSIILFTIILPLLCFEAFNHLIFTSITGLVAVAFVLIALLVRGIPMFKENIHPLQYVWNIDGFLSLPVFCWSWSAQQFVPIIYSMLDGKTKTEASMHKINQIAVLCAFFIFTLFGVIGSIIFGSDTEEIILDNFKVKDVIILISRILLVINIVSSFPLIYYLIQRMAIRYFCCLAENENIPIFPRVFLSFVLVSLTLFLAVLVPQFQYVGLFASVWIQFVIPGLLLITPIAWLHPLTKSNRKRLRKIEDQIRKEEYRIRKTQDHAKGILSPSDVNSNDDDDYPVDPEDLLLEERAEAAWKESDAHPSLIWEAMEDEDRRLKKIWRDEKMKDISPIMWFRSISQFAMGLVVLVAAILANLRAARNGKF